MAKYPRPLDGRWAATLGELQRRLRQVEVRTMGIDTGFPLMCLPGVIDSAYSSGDPHVYVNGAAALTGPYQYVTSYTPHASDAVLLAPVVALQTYIVIGKLSG